MTEPSSGSTQSPGSTTTQAGQPVKPGTTTTTSAMSAGLGASVEGFNIQSFQADLFTGSAGAEIPIVVPPGAAGVAPKIALGYTSNLVDDFGITGKNNQADWVGLGWNLETGGFVLRESKGTIATSDDKFKLIFGGVTHELISIGSGNYRTKDETFLAITFVSASDYWTVKTKDGTIHRFGFNSNSRATGLTFGPNKEAQVTFRYYLDDVKTTSGTQVKYNYFKQSSSYNKKDYDQAVYLDTIAYAYRNDSLIGTAREVRFIRGSRTDWDDVSKQWHASYHQLYRLDAIEAKVGAGLARRYEFSYDYSIDREPGKTWQGGATGDLTLKTVTIKGSNGTTALPSLTFTYSDAVLAGASNGLGGSVTFVYEYIQSLYGVWNEDNLDNCTFNGMSNSAAGNCGSQGLLGILSKTSDSSTIAFNEVRNENDLDNCVFSGFSSTTQGDCGAQRGYLYTTQIFDAMPLYDVWNENDLDNCRFVNFSSTGPGDCAGQLRGYRRPGEVDGPRHRVISRTVSDGRGWSSTTNYVYFNPGITTDAFDVKRFAGHGKVRTIDPLGNYTDTWFHQDEIKKGRPSQIEVRNSAGALFNKTLHTYTTSNPYTGVTFVALTRSDYFECEGQASCHQNAETFTFDTYGNKTQKNDLGD